MVSKSTYPVSINSDPDAAEIRVVNRAGREVFQGKTPAKVTLKAGAGFWKGEDYTVIFKKSGYADLSAQIHRGVDGWYLGGNFIFGGLLGWLIIDPATGAMWKLEDLAVTLTQEEGEPIAQGQIYIVTPDEVPAHLRTKMTRIN